MHKAQSLGRKQIRTPAAVLEDAQLDVDLLRQQHTRVVVLLVDARALFVCVLGLCVSKASTTLTRSIHPSPTRTYIHTSKPPTNQHKHKKRTSEKKRRRKKEATPPQTSSSQCTNCVRKPCLLSPALLSPPLEVNTYGVLRMCVYGDEHRSMPCQTHQPNHDAPPESHPPTSTISTASSKMTAKNVDETTVSATRCASYRRSHARPARRASHILMFCGAFKEKWGMS